MFDERVFIQRVEAAGPDELLALLRHPSAQEQDALRAYLGDERYRRMHALALRQRRAEREPLGNVVVIHGIMGSELTAYRAGKSEHIWAKIFKLVLGRIARLRLDPTGQDEADRRYQVHATGIMKRHYGELLLSLAQDWRTRAFWYDWRKDLSTAAAELEARLTGWFGLRTPVHLVAHSMGGLVARTFMLQYPERWKRLADEGSLERGGRLIMLGTPNHGSFTVPQILTGLEGTLRKLAAVDLSHSLEQLVDIVATYPGIYQMLPSPTQVAKVKPLYDTKTWAELAVSQRHLDRARAHHELLKNAVDADRMVYIAGYDQPTFSGIRDFSRLGEKDAYEMSLQGDGRVPHDLGLLDGVPSYYIPESHGNLPANTQILGALGDLLRTGRTSGLADKLPRPRARMTAKEEEKVARQRYNEQEKREAVALESFLRRSRTARAMRAEEPEYVSVSERLAEDLLTRGFLTDEHEVRGPVRDEQAGEIPSIEVRLVFGWIESVDDILAEDRPVDALAVGHYVGVTPQAAELGIDRAISAALGTDSDEGPVLTQLTERGTLRGELGVPFLVPDPRDANGSAARIIAIVGMGIPGRFGESELTVLARELVWLLGRLGKKHLATVLIGAGNGNIPPRQAVRGWFRGIAQVLAGADKSQQLRRITFVEADPERIGALKNAIEDAAGAFEQRLVVDYASPDDAALAQVRETIAAAAQERADLARTGDLELGDDGQSPDEIPTRLTVALDGDTYRFAAITSTAAVPERQIPLDPNLVTQANEELAGEWSDALQRERGEFLSRLLLPEDLRPELQSAAPLVLLLDSTTARIHWEMVGQARPAGRGRPARAEIADLDFESCFLGTARGLTRQLQTSFAPLPEPPPPPRQVLNVLVVADPAEDAHLPGAEEEGAAVADLFESFNTIHGGSTTRIAVRRLFGPRDATRTNVLRQLMLHSYDVLHFAGHCTYDRDEPRRSGWIFSRGERLSAHELTRVDRVPKFVFSNACESGITPDRSEKRSVELAPTFAEAFFKQGVANFVCTAWPVDDQAALGFSLVLYARLLGITVRQKSQGWKWDGAEIQDDAVPATRLFMYEAMREARLAVAKSPGGARTWGAYQHYGNPFFRLVAGRSPAS